MFTGDLAIAVTSGKISRKIMAVVEGKGLKVNKTVVMKGKRETEEKGSRLQEVETLGYLRKTAASGEYETR